MRTLLLLPIVLSTLIVSSARAAIFEPRDGDRIALIGDALIEREGESGWLETVINAAYPDRHITVRNLGWSGDTPAGISRLSFDFNDTNKGLQLLSDATSKVDPTVIVLGYGMACSFDGQAGVAKFTAEMEKLIDTLQKNAKHPIRFVILSPLQHELLPPPLPNPTAHNAQLALYTDALRKIADEHEFPFVNLFAWKPSNPPREVTDNGIHLTPVGYQLMALEVARQLGWKVKWKSSDEKTIEAMRAEVVRKNQFFFDRWRPQNQTYLLGFRQSEQGKNAKEIPLFDPLIDESEDRIFQWKQLLVTKLAAAPVAMPVKEMAKGSNAPALPDFTVAPGFEVSLWASSPLLKKPTQINFDPQGRMWVAESSVYPQIEPGQKANDKIVILEDTHHTGHADKSTVFVEGLFLPTAVEPGDGGCYVGQSTELLFFPGKEKAEGRRVVLSGFGTEDTHHMVHTLAWGPDGMLYFDQSIYIHSHLETPNGVVRLNSGGVWHLRPPSMELGVFIKGFCNPWGHQFDQYGQSFVTDGAGGQGITWGIEGATYFTYASMRRELASISPGSYPKFCGLEIIHSTQFPDDWQGNMITADFRAHRIVRFGVTEDASGYVTTQMPDVLRTTNDSFRPIDMKMGPDGALYIADWCNPIINHGEVDFRDPRRDHDHGRIWRLTAKGRPLAPYRDFTRESNNRLFDNLLSSNVYEVEQSRRVLTERKDRILADLTMWTAKQTNEGALMQSLWMHQAIGVRNNDLLDRMLAAHDGHLRTAATRVLAAWPRTHGGDPDEIYHKLLQDPFPRVRVEALRAVAEIPSVRSAEWALEIADTKPDSFLEYALWLTINDLVEPWLRGVKEGKWSADVKQDQLVYALRAIEPDRATPVLAEILKKQRLDREGKGPWIELIGQIGTASEIQNLFDGILEKAWTPDATERAWSALNAAAKRDVCASANTEKLAQFFDDGDDSIRVKAIRLAGSWKVSASLSNLCAEASKPDVSDDVRKAAFESLRKIGGPEVIAAVQPWTTADHPMTLREPAVLTLAAIDTQHSGEAALALLRDVTNEQTQLKIWKSLLGNSGAAGVLGAALPKSGFPAPLAKAGIRAMHEGANEPELVVALTRAAGLQGADAEMNKLEVMRLAESVLNHGDPARGERIFRSQQQSCAACHSIGGVGGHVGPDLTSIGASAQPDYLIESVYYPNKEIKDGFQSVRVSTTDGEEVTGILVRENDHELVLRDATDKEVTIAKAQIATRKAGGSLMPSGLTDSLSMQQQLDLFAFLANLGKAGPFDASSQNVARFWKVSSLAEPGDHWHAVSSLVDGRLLRDDVLSHVDNGGKGAVCASATFRLATDGQVDFNVPNDAKVFIDAKTVPVSDGKISADLPAGNHTIVLEYDDGAKWPQTVQLKSARATFLTK